MQRARWVGLLAVCAVLAGLSSLAMADAGDPVKDQLQQARDARTQAREKAKSALVQGIDAQIKSAGAAGDLDTLKILTNQKDAFTTAGALPTLPALKDATAEYSAAIRKADGSLVAAYETAIEAYTKDSNADEASRLRKERRALLEGGGDQPSAESPEAIGVLLDRAKSDYQQSVADAKKTYLQAIDTRINSASDAGDLGSVTKLKSARAAAESDAPLPEGFTDVAVVTAKSRYSAAVRAANQRLAQGYRDAVRNYTRIRALDKAEATQAELDATGLGAAAAGAGASSGAGPSSEGTIRLSRALPWFLLGSGPFSAEKEGIKPSRETVIATKGSDFLTKDFIFDVTVRIPKDEEWVNVGVGDGTTKGSVSVVIRNDGGWGRRAFLTHGDEWGQHIGDIHNDELYTIRLERHGGPITASVGTVTAGKFAADMSQTVSDLKEFAPGVTEKRSKLFFRGSVVYSQVRLATGASANVSSAEGHDTDTPIKFPAPGAQSANPAVPGAGVPAGTPGVVLLNTPKLPPGWESTGTYSVTSQGLIPYDKTQIMTTDADFLSKDFVFEATVDVPRKQDWIVVGLGDGTEKGSVRFVVRPDENWGTRAFLTLGDEWGKHLSDVRDAGTRVIRIERHGGPVTLSMGTDDSGKFETEVAQTVPDPKAAVAELSERRGRLFFQGKTTWMKLRLVTGAAAANDPAPADDAPAATKSKKKSR
jgi:hypothetical protein